MQNLGLPGGKMGGEGSEGGKGSANPRRGGSQGPGACEHPV